jgi:hypothetical protein
MLSSTFIDEVIYLSIIYRSFTPAFTEAVAQMKLLEQVCMNISVRFEVLP